MPRRGINFALTTTGQTQGLRKMNYALRRYTTSLKKASRAAMVQGERIKNVEGRWARYTRTVRRSKRPLQQLSRNIHKVRREQKKLNQETTAGINIMRRLVTAMVIFGVSHKVVQGFRALVGTAVEFNKTMESAQLGIAALISAAGKVVDPYGRLLDVSEKFAFAQGEARRQVQLLRKDALATEATFQELMNVFQLGIAPGLTAGMELDDIRKFSVRISQAATALQMPQRQLAEEIRSILRGTIRLQSTRIAAALNISNRQIRRWRQLGTLGKELFERFEAFGEASKELRETWVGLSGRVRDAFQQLAGTAGIGFFETLKNQLKDIFSLMVDIGDEGITLNRALVGAFRQFFGALRRIVLYARDAVDNLSMEGFESVMDGIASAMEQVGKAVVDIVVAVKNGVSLFVSMLAPVKVLASVLDGIGLPLNEILKIAVSLTTTWVLLWSTTKAFRFALFGIIAPLKVIYNNWNLIAKAAKGAARYALMFGSRIGKMGNPLSLIFNKWVLLVGIVAAFAATLSKVITEAHGMSWDLFAQIEIGVLGVFEYYRTMLSMITTIGASIGDALNYIFNKLGTSLKSVGKELEGLLKDTSPLYQLMKLAGMTKGEGSAAALGARAGAGMGVLEEKVDNLKEADTIDSFKKLTDSISNRFSKQFEDMERFASGEWMNEYFQKYEERGGAYVPTKLKTMFADVKKSIGSALGGISSAVSKFADDLQAPMGKIVDIPEVMAGTQFQKLEDARARVESLADKFAKVEKHLANIKSMKQEELFASMLDEGTLPENLNETLDVINDIEKQQARLNRTKETEIHLAEEAYRKAQQQFHLLELQAEGGIWSGMEAGLLKFAYNTQTTFEGIRDVVTSAMNQLASVVSQTLVDAFDPTKDVNLKERFARFLQSIAQMAIETFLKIAMAKAIAFAFGGGGGAAASAVSGAAKAPLPSLPGNVSVGSYAHGGMIPRRAQASLAHYTASQGLAQGGRPAGLHPTDTVPIWAAPGEFMMKVDAVRRYGADVMAKINAGLVDPAGLRGLASSVRASRRRSSGPGFAAGGKVPQDQQVPVQSGGVNRSILVANDETADMLLNGGRAAVLRFLAENKDDVNGALA